MKPKRQKTFSQRLKKAVPPPDNPLLRHQGNEGVPEAGTRSEKQMAELRLKALEQARQVADKDSSDPLNKTKGADGA